MTVNKKMLLISSMFIAGVLNAQVPLPGHMPDHIGSWADAVYAEAGAGHSPMHVSPDSGFSGRPMSFGSPDSLLRAQTSPAAGPTPVAFGFDDIEIGDTQFDFAMQYLQQANFEALLEVLVCNCFAPDLCEDLLTELKNTPELRRSREETQCILLLNAMVVRSRGEMSPHTRRVFAVQGLTTK